MSDLDNLLALKKMLENKDKPDEKTGKTREERFITDATKALYGNATVGLQGYKPDDMIAFLTLPVEEQQSRLGGEWAQMSRDEFDTLAYTLKQKIQKSSMLLDWK